ncbi:LOW QUALITY PROTEIN: hypothetical protein Cgig2_001074 [Carnegiea gigantea]|uniref:Uncharacterized protein n=1 Tax=Carnegiea gigantea TaxID=171969 RepID=A0A9Q1K2X5_9CARY|nr:LOW QUALITY PROTEIN: hypothetical protein Cgig2_001074 [Carnegiea gigantea]
MEVAGSAKPVHEEEPSGRPEGMPPLHPVERSYQVARSDRSDRLLDGWQGGRATVDPIALSARGKTAVLATASTHYATHSKRTAWLEEHEGHLMLRQPPPMTAPPRPQNAQKYCELHEQNGHTTTKCRELKKALHELADKGQIDQFLKRGPRFLRQEQTIAPPPPRDEECSTEVVATIAGGYVEEITRTALKAQLRSAQQEVNPTGMIRLPVRFGDKSKFKSLEADFLVVDVPTAYNVIIGWPTLHRVKAEVKATMNKRGWGLHVGLSAVLTTSLLRHTSLSFQRIGGLVLSNFTLRRRGDKFHLLGIAALHSSLFAFVHKAQALKYQSSENSPARVSKTLRGRPSGLVDSPAPWPGLHQSWPSPADAASLFHSPLGPPGASHNAFGTGKRVPPAAGTLRRLHPLGKDLSHCHLLLGHLWGVRSPRGGQVPGLDYVLDQRKSNIGVRLDKASRRPRGERGGAAGNWGRSSCGFGDSGVPRPSRGPVPGRPTSRQASRRSADPLFPQWRGGGGPSLIRLLLGRLLLTDRQTHDRPLPAGYKGWRLQEGVLSQSQRKTKGGKASKGHIPYLFGLLGNKKLPLFLSLTLDSGRHLFRSGVPGLEHLSKRLSTLSDILKDKKAGRNEKQVVRKKLQSKEPV